MQERVAGTRYCRRSLPPEENAMPRMLSLLLFATMPLSACAPAADAPAVVAAAPSLGTTSSSSASTVAAEAPGADPVDKVAQTRDANASIRGAIREGNRSPPAMRICAHPVAGGAATCIDSPAGARAYRIAVAPGSYYLLGWVEGGELVLIAHASQIRCIRAPCPPDTLIEVDVAAGEDKAGIDLAGAYVEVPAGWPTRP